MIASGKRALAALRRLAGRGTAPNDIESWMAWAWFAVQKPWVVAAFGVGGILTLFIAVRLTMPWVPTTPLLQFITPPVCQFLAGMLFLMVLFKLLCLRDPRAAPWWVTLVAIIVAPLVMVDATTLALPWTTWAQTMAESHAGELWVPWWFAVGALALVPGFVAFGATYLGRSFLKSSGRRR